MTPKKTDPVQIISVSDTVLTVTYEQFWEVYEKAGYRKLGVDEPVPLQMVEFEAGYGQAIPQGVALAEPPTADDLAAIRKERGGDGGA